MKMVKVGWSWTMFFFATGWGIIWFIRGLHDWGVMALIFALLYFLISLVSSNSGLETVFFLIAVGCNIFAALKGNEITAKRYLATGYEFAEPNSEVTKYAKAQWGTTD